MGALYKVTMNGDIASSIPFVITHYYNCPSAVNEDDNRNAIELLQEFTLGGRVQFFGQFYSIPAGLLLMSSNQVVMRSIQVMNMYNPFDFTEVGASYAGIANETSEGTGAAYLFSTNRARRDIARGKRYIPGVAASAFSTNTLTSDFRVRSAEVANALSFVFECGFVSGASGNATPVILGSKYVEGTENPKEYERYSTYETAIANSYTAVFDGTGSYPKLAWLRGRAR